MSLLLIIYFVIVLIIIFAVLVSKKTTRIIFLVLFLIWVVFPVYFVFIPLFRNEIEPGRFFQELFQGDSDFREVTWSWERTEYGDGELIEPREPGIYQMTLTSDGKIQLRVDCNRAFGKYEIQDQALQIVGPMAMTRAMCPNPEVSDAYMKDLDRVQKIRAKGDHLVIGLKQGAGMMVFRKSLPEESE